MNNDVHIKASSILISTRISLPASLRWLRRAVTMILIVSNFAIATCAQRADAAGARSAHDAQEAAASLQTWGQAEFQSVRKQLTEAFKLDPWNVGLEKKMGQDGISKSQSATMGKMTEYICSMPAWLWVSSFQCELPGQPN